MTRIRADAPARRMRWEEHAGRAGVMPPEPSPTNEGRNCLSIAKQVCEEFVVATTVRDEAEFQELSDEELERLLCKFCVPRNVVAHVLRERIERIELLLELQLPEPGAQRKSEPTSTHVIPTWDILSRLGVRDSELVERLDRSKRLALIRLLVLAQYPAGAKQSYI